MKKNDLLIEIGTEELPSTELKSISDQFSLSLSEVLKKHKISFDSYKPYAAPRRITTIVYDVADRQENYTVEKIGPTLERAYNDDKSPTKAALGFAKSCGVNIDELEICNSAQGKKLFYKKEFSGKSINSLIQNILEETIKNLNIKKTMRWANNNFSFARPVKWLVAMHGSNVLDLELFGEKAQNHTRGHRVYKDITLEIKDPKNYVNLLEENFCIPDFYKRKNLIKQSLNSEAKKINASVEISEELLSEVTCLVDFPTVLIGNFNKNFLSLPNEVLKTAMQVHQKSFLLIKDDKPTNAFLFVTNNICKNYKKIIEGNEKVMHARLSDAQFFYTQDIKTPLKNRLSMLKNITYHKKLGSIYDKVKRVTKIAEKLVKYTKAKKDNVSEAANLYKCDLTTSMVYEFTDLQGIIGSHYADKEGFNTEISTAIKESYMPRSLEDETPLSATGITIAIADKIDSIVSICSIGLCPTGEKDPFALRRAAIGIVKTIIHHETLLNIDLLIDLAVTEAQITPEKKDELSMTVKKFFLDRIKFYLKKEFSHNTVEAVLTTQKLEPYNILLKLSALKAFSQTSSAQNLFRINKRISNILSKSQLIGNSLSEKDISFKINLELLETSEEKALYTCLTELEEKHKQSLEAKKYLEVLNNLLILERPLDSFFNNVMVNVDKEEIKNNRLTLLYRVSLILGSIADLSRVAD